MVSNFVASEFTVGTLSYWDIKRGTSCFVCTHMTHVERTVHKLEHKADVGLFLCVTFSYDSLQRQCTLSDIEN